MRDGGVSAPLIVLAFDFGFKRIGMAVGDSVTGTAAPRGTVAGGPDWIAIEREVRAHQPGLLVVGAPLQDDGSAGPMARAAHRFALELEGRFGIPVREVNERFSSMEAGSALKAGRASGARPRRVRKDDIDSAAAAVILERFFAGEEQRRGYFAPMSEVAQMREDGSLRHLLSLQTLPTALIEKLLDRAQGFVHPPGKPHKVASQLEGVTVANLFTEPSTRTRVSFELAAKRLGAQVVNLEVQLSSRVKGESMLDTVFTLEALNVDVLVIREAEAGVLDLVAGHVAPHVSVLSAGEAHVSHPTQGLLDALTVRQAKGRFDKLSLAIVGDVRHSRVARSAYQVFRALGVPDIRVVAPAAFMPESGEFEGSARHASLRTGLKDVDVVMMLRIQKERMSHTALLDADRYFAKYGLTPERLALAKPDAIVMHPQPMNRGIEIASDVADGPQSVIRQQVRNGVAVRMAVLATVMESRARA
jgi:aspartate carbamoyltransferase catalytic subunit